MKVEEVHAEFTDAAVRARYVTLQMLNAITGKTAAQTDLVQLRADVLDTLGLSEVDAAQCVTETARNAIIGEEKTPRILAEEATQEAEREIAREKGLAD